MSDTINADGTVETPTIEELQAKLAKAEGKIVEMKKTSKETNVVEEPNTETPNYMTREDFEKERFFEVNSELLDHKDKINEYVSKGYSLEDAKTVLLSQDKTIEARKNTQNSNFTSGTPDFSKSTYTMDELSSLSQSEYNKVIKMREEGKAIIT